jgi:uncharacterized protein involved in copper resistance
VKTLRLFVLVLLAMLLSLRGVSAAALLCEQQPVSHTQVVEVEVDAHEHDTASMPGHDHANHDHDHGHSDFDKGRHCVSSCSALPLMAVAPTVLTPTLAGTTVFPRFAAPAPTFQSGGQDRPPRSI